MAQLDDPLGTFGYDRPSVWPALIVADSEIAARAGMGAVTAAGMPARQASFQQAANDASAYDGVGLLLVEGVGARPELFDLVLARADSHATSASLDVIVSVAPDQIDAAAAQLHGRHVQLLCEPSIAERAAAVAFASARARGRVRDNDGAPETAELQRLSEQVARIAETLARFSREEPAPARQGVRGVSTEYRGPDEPKIAVPVTAAEIRQLIRARRLRSNFFEPELFADPAWDMLLDLFAAEMERRQVSVSSLCIAAAVPPTTALRWIATLHEAGLFERHADPADRRRAYIGLSQKGMDSMRSYIAAVRRAGLSLA